MERWTNDYKIAERVRNGWKPCFPLQSKLAGEGVYATLMEISDAEYEIRQKTKMLKIDAVDAAMRGETFGKFLYEPERRSISSRIKRFFYKYYPIHARNEGGKIRYGISLQIDPNSFAVFLKFPIWVLSRSAYATMALNMYKGRQVLVAQFGVRWSRNIKKPLPSFCMYKKPYQSELLYTREQIDDRLTTEQVLEICSNSEEIKDGPWRLAIK